MQVGFEIRQIKYGSEEYRKELELRNKVLRKPLGLNLFDEDLSGEVNDFHIGVFLKEALIGILILTKVNDSQIKMRQVGIEEELRGKHIGRSLVSYSEGFAKGRGYGEIILNARKTAVPFYERLGYKKLGGEFTEVTIPHFKMHKEI